MADTLVARPPKSDVERPSREAAFDPARLRRAVQRGVVRMGPLQFRVQGTHQKFYDVNLELDTPCDCMDAQMRGRGCLHELAARLHSGDTKLIQSLGEMLFAAEKHAAR